MQEDWLQIEGINISTLSPELVDCVRFINDNIDKSGVHSVSNVASGMGDMLIKRNNHPQEKVFWNMKHLFDYNKRDGDRLGDTLKNIRFKIELLRKLYDKEHVIVFYNVQVKLHTSGITTMRFEPSLIHCFSIPPRRYDFKYMVIHTKLRPHADQSTSSILAMKTQLKAFFLRFKPKHRIVILGEKTMPSFSDIPTITTIYDECMALRKNNDIIDLTREGLFSAPDMAGLEEDMGIIRNAELNVGVGHGGQFCINLLFSPRSIYYCTPGLINFSIQNPHMHVLTDMGAFFDLCKQITS